MIDEDQPLLCPWTNPVQKISYILDIIRVVHVQKKYLVMYSRRVKLADLDIKVAYCTLHGPECGYGPTRINGMQRT